MKCKNATEHSRPKRLLSFLTFTAVLLIGGLLLPRHVSAQMFTIQENGNQSFQIPQTSIFIGLEVADFSQRGEGISEDEDNDYEFNGPLLRFELETPNISLYMGTGGNLTGLEDRTYFQAGIKGSYNFNAMDEEHFTLRIPAMIQTDITTVTNTAQLANSQFQQGAFLFGLGATIEVRPDEAFRMEIWGMPKYGVSFSSGGTFGGHAQGFEAGSQLSLDNVFGSVGLTAGYTYAQRVYDVDLIQFDYDLSGHTILVGITF